jgi:serine protease
MSFAPGEAIVTFRDPPSWSVGDTIAGHRIAPVLALGTRTYLLRFADPTLRAANGHAATREAIADLATAAAVESAVANLLVPLALVPSDPLYSPYQLWNYQGALHLPQAWDVTVGSGSVRVAVIDTGKTAHPDLSWGPGRDIIDQDDDPTDVLNYNHGIHVAGIIAARTNNGLGGAGVCWNCTLVPVRAGSGDGVTIANMAAAIRWVAGWNDPFPAPFFRRAEVINMSFSGDVSCLDADLTVVRDAVADAIGRAGISLVASAGNSGRASSGFPGNCPGVLSAAASQPDGQLAPYSNRGTDVDLTAPGGGFSNTIAGAEDFGSDIGQPPCPRTGPANPNNDPYAGTNGVVSSWSSYLPGPQQTAADHCYRYLSGTSMAAPHIAGVIGLMRSVNPTLSPGLVSQYLIATAQPVGVLCPIPGQCGAGMVDAYAAVLAARDGLPIVDVDVVPGSLVVPDTQLARVSAPSALIVRNVGTGTLTATVSSPTAELQLACGAGACACPTTAACNITVSGQPVIVNVRYAPAVSGPFSANLAVTSNDPVQPSLAIPVTGNATFSRASASPSRLVFGFTEVGKFADQIVTLANAGTAPLVISSLTLTGNTGDFSVLPVALPIAVASFANVKFTVRCKPTVAGHRSAALTIVTDANIAAAPIGVSVDARAPEAHVTLDTPDFGEQVVGTTATHTLRVQNISTGSNSFNFTLTRPAPPFTLTCTNGCTCATPSTCTGTVVSGNRADLAVSYTPPEVGSHSTSFSFTSDAPNLPSAQVTATGVGVVAPLSGTRHAR